MINGLRAEQNEANLLANYCFN